MAVWRDCTVKMLNLIDALRSYVRLVYSECMTYLTCGKVQVGLKKKEDKADYILLFNI